MALVDRNSQNNEHANVPENHSRFELNFPLAGNYRFGEISPHFAERVVADDKRMRCMSGTETRSLNLKSPLMQGVKMNKDYFQVPMPAILPLNWDKIYIQPNIGEDVVAKNVGCVVDGWLSKVNTILSRWKVFIDGLAAQYDEESTFLGYSWNARSLSSAIRYLNLMKSIFSSGSIFSQLGDNFWNLFKAIPKSKDNQDSYQYLSFDAFYDSIMTSLRDLIETKAASSIYFIYKDRSTDSVFYRVIGSLDDSVSNRDFYDSDSNQTIVTISFRRFIELCTSNPSFYCDFVQYDEDDEEYKSVSIVYTEVFNFIFDWKIFITGNGGKVDLSKIPLNNDVFAAYQLVCSEYFSNDKVDYIYSAELHRQVLRSAYKQFFALDNSHAGLDVQTFTWNGNDYLYDEFSAKLLVDALNTLFDYFEDNLDYSALFLEIWNLIYGVRNSLRFMDYFTGSKTRPLAPVDVDVAVVNNSVSMVDIARAKGFLRLAFAVNRIGRKISKYSEELMHVAPPVDYHHAWYLARTSDVLGSTDTENTNINPTDDSTENVQTTISNIHAASNNYAFEVDININSVIIGVTSYDINRLYDKTYSRFNWHFDRYEMFNPLLQFTGDQEVISTEYDSGSPATFNLGYQNKYEEYKQRFGRCFGALVYDNVLPGWVMTPADRINVDGNVGLSPSFIRSFPHEFDKFFISLTGMSPATYFHFIVKHDNMLSIDRPMVAKPKIM